MIRMPLSPLLLLHVLGLVLLGGSNVSALTIRIPQLRTTPGRRQSTALHDISEWRDLPPHTENAAATSPSAAVTAALANGLFPKEVCVLPFPYQEVLLQGETKQLRLYEERFVELFETAMNEHCGVVAMGLIASQGLIQSVPLAEMEAYSRIDGFGIFVTIRVVARASLLTITQETPYIKAICTEITDQAPTATTTLEEPNLLASNIENYMLLLSSMEHRLETAKLEQGVQDPDDVDLVMKQRILLAKLEDTYYDENIDNDDDSLIDRRKRFRRAYEVALSTDTQGYQTMATTVTAATTTNTTATSTTSPSTEWRSTRELTAISWAALCTELVPEPDAAIRIQALDGTNLVERLQLAASSLRAKQSKLKHRLQKAGLSYNSDDETDAA